MRTYLFIAGLIGLFSTTAALGQAGRPSEPGAATGRGAGNLALGAVAPGYFMFPIMPGGENSLSGGLGDLRGNHFHAGLDIRTQGREGLNVYAAADGYVSRIAVFTGGYGNVIFIKHPNGLTTVYGHLKTLNDTLGTYLRQQQYEKRTFEIDLRPQPNQFPVRKGDIIALSGNTGGSGGPHLHFEVRDAGDNLINPLLYGFTELQDNVPPYFERIALKTMTPTSRINGEYQRLTLVPVRQADGSYVLNKPITASGLLGLEVLAYDKTSGSPYRNGINCLELKLDGREVFAYNMNTFPHEQTRFINVHMNYEVEQLTGQRYHRGYIADGNALSLYKLANNAQYRGRLPLLDGQPHEVTVTIYDVFDQSAQLRFTVLPDTTQANGPARDSFRARPATFTPDELDADESGTASTPTATITNDENILKLTVRNVSITNPPPARLFAGRNSTETPVSYVRGNVAVYVIDLRKILPDSVQIGNGIVRTNLKKRILPGRKDVFSEGGTRLEFSPATLFDTLHLAMRQLPGGGLEINQHTIPLNDYLAVQHTPTYPIAIDTMRTKAYMTSGGRRKFLGGTWRNGRIEFKTRDLGQFQLFTDTQPPTVQILSATPKGITAKIRDDLSGINQFRALVNGEWVLMQYDYKRALLWSDKLNPDEPFAEGSEVLVQVKDNAGNIGSDSITIETPRPVVRKKATTKRRGRKR